MIHLVNLNQLAEPTSTPTINNDWLEVQDLKNSNYTFGFWAVVVRNSQNGQQFLDFKGVSKDRLLENLKAFGFAKRYRTDGSYILIKHVDNILEEVTPAQIKDFCLELIDQLPEAVEICGFKIQTRKLKEIFLNEHRQLFTTDALSPLFTHTKELIADTKSSFYFPFKNCVVEVVKNDVKCIQYSDLNDACIWKNHIKQRDFVADDAPCMFADFVANVAGDKVENFKLAIGYLLHRYLTPTNTKAVILYDEQITDADSANGGTGKGIFSSAVGQCRELCVINGKRFDTSQRFALQSINERTQLVLIDDVLPDFDFEFFNSTITDGWELEQKNKQSIRIPFEQSPKLLISANQILKQKKGTTASRRQFILEFSDFYSSMLKTTQTPVVDVHGCEFFSEWNDVEFNRFFSYIFDCCKLYLQKGLPVVEPKNVKQNLLLQQTCKDFVDWADEMDFKQNFDYSTSEFYSDFKNVAFGESSMFGTATFNKWLQLYAETHNFKFKKHRYNKVYYFRFMAQDDVFFPQIDDDNFPF